MATKRSKDTAEAETSSNPAKRPRGRPRKNPLPEADAPAKPKRAARTKAAAAEVEPALDPFGHAGGEIHLPVGYINPASAAVGELRLPVLEDIDAARWVYDAIDTAVTSRKGQVVLGDKGVGKSMALTNALSTFAEIEKAQRDKDPRYQIRHLVHVRNLRAKTYRDAVVFVWQRLTKTDAVTRIRGRVRTDDELMSELVTHLLMFNVAALVIDEAEHLTPAALDVLRDIMSISETSAKERISQAGYGTAGIGLVLIGTPATKVLLDDSEEWGQRFTTIRYVDGVAAEAVPDAYKRLVPAFAAAAKEMGSRRWASLIGEVVTRGADQVSLRGVENHIRQYAYRMNSIEAGTGRSVESLGWNQEIFEYAASELLLG